MRKIILLGVLVVLAGCGWTTQELVGRPQSSPEQEKISSVSDTATCTFIKSMYIETQPQTLNYYVKKNTANAGGDSYKIISTNNQIVAGTNIMMINFEVYKCKGPVGE